jgi:FtsZ-binding cell division protein ZapB
MDDNEISEMRLEIDEFQRELDALEQEAELLNTEASADLYRNAKVRLAGQREKIRSLIAKADRLQPIN